MDVVSSGASDVGQVREKNEDSYLIDDQLSLFVVADGMGGHLGGKTASSLAVSKIEEGIRNQREAIAEAARAKPLASSVVPRLLADTVREACNTIFDKAAADPELQGMGTTVTAMLALEDRGFIAHVGDSRCYLQRGNRVVQLTDDHSLVNEQIKAGLLTPEQAATSRLKNIITRSVGFERDVAVDTFAMPLQEGDRFLICSDGLSNLVDDTEIGDALARLNLESIPTSMVELANARGGDDNITVVCLAVGSQNNSA